MNRTGLDDLDAVMAYVQLARRDIGKAERQAALETAYPGLGESMLRTTRVEGIEEGKKIGRQEGAVETARESVLEVLRARFGKVPRRVLSRVRATDDRATLMEWLRLAGTADSLAAFQAELE